MQATVFALHQEPGRQRDRHRAYRAAARLEGADEPARVPREEVHEAREVADDDRLSLGKRLSQLSVGKLVLLPDRLAVAAVERVHRTFVVTDVRIARVEADPGRRGKLSRPDLAPARHLVAPHPPLVSNSADFAPLQCGTANDVGNALELGRA